MGRRGLVVGRPANWWWSGEQFDRRKRGFAVLSPVLFSLAVWEREGKGADAALEMGLIR